MFLPNFYHSAKLWPIAHKLMYICITGYLPVKVKNMCNAKKFAIGRIYLLYGISEPPWDMATLLQIPTLDRFSISYRIICESGPIFFFFSQLIPETYPWDYIWLLRDRKQCNKCRCHGDVNHCFMQLTGWCLQWLLRPSHIDHLYLLVENHCAHVTLYLSGLTQSQFIMDG